MQALTLDEKGILKKEAGMANEWSDEELKASVVAYMEMLKKENEGIHYVKKHICDKLADKYHRTSKSFEFRMQNISYIYSLLGRQFLKGFKPKSHVGRKIIQRLEKLISEIENKPYIPIASFESAVMDLLTSNKTIHTPEGIKNPISYINNITIYSRDSQVKAWVLKNANGICEACQQKAPFLTHNEIPFLEIHHVKQLSDGGSDTITNVVALCPNCHRKIHYGQGNDELKSCLYSRIKRLIRE